MGSNAGNRHVSAGNLAFADTSTARTPIVNAAVSDAGNIFTNGRVFVRMNLNECPAAAMSAQYRYALRGGRLIAAKPIAAIAANNAS